jgi:hypothetical protein
MERETGNEPATSSLGSEHSCDFYYFSGGGGVRAELHWSQQLNLSEGDYRRAQGNELGFEKQSAPRDVTGNPSKRGTEHHNSAECQRYFLATGTVPFIGGVRYKRTF